MLRWRRLVIAILPFGLITGCSSAPVPSVPPLGVAPARIYSKALAELYVNDYSNNDVAIFKNGTWGHAGTITSGVSCPEGNWVDRRGNLYVVNGCHGTPSVAEYAPGATTPSFTYSDIGNTTPISVTVDGSENVYVADLDGVVAEYHQKHNKIAVSCQLYEYDYGVAVDNSGDVFVDYYDGSVGRIAEYKGGLTGCTSTTLGATVRSPGSLVLDTHDNIVVCDQSGSVDIIDPPYSSVSATLGSGYSEPFQVTINKKNTQAYVADTGARVVDVLAYPSGTKLATLGPANGLTLPDSAVDGQNYNP